MIDPFTRFHQWWQEASNESPLQQKNAACISTVDEQGFPSGRFVDLKAVDDRGFTFCTCLNSAKGKQISANPKTAITIWWDHVGYQVRIVGVAEPIGEAEALALWKERSRSAQLATNAFEQSQPLNSENELRDRIDSAGARLCNTEIPKPEDWGGFCVRPGSVEFLTFKENRLHLREFYEKRNNVWTMQLLQP